MFIYTSWREKQGKDDWMTKEKGNYKKLILKCTQTFFDFLAGQKRKKHGDKNVKKRKFEAQHSADSRDYFLRKSVLKQVKSFF